MAGFLDALRARCEVVELDGGRDWRRGVDWQDEPDQKWFGPDERGFEDMWQTHGGGDGESFTVYMIAALTLDRASFTNIDLWSTDQHAQGSRAGVQIYLRRAL